MSMPTGYQYAKLGSNLEYLRGICSASLPQAGSLAAFPDLRENLPARALPGGERRGGAPFAAGPTPGT